MIEAAQSTVTEAYRLFDSEVGVCGLAWSGSGVRRLQLPEADVGATERRLRSRAAVCDGEPPDTIQRLIRDLQNYFAGGNVDFADVALDLAGVSAFYRRLYDLARAVGWGETVTYGELARRAGLPGAARAVGQAMSRNPVPIIVPCHRVLASGANVGGFSAPGGRATKQRLLALEGVHPGGTPRLPGL
jgi:methylated-DNA-[protein]-cysteine S-methyltransferase